jgi:4-amino-4-deoxy-L-arabinose transferase-like glycosyltransferase
MRLDRSLLYAGVFLIAVGGTFLAVDAGGVDTATLTGAMRLWPAALVAVGVALVLRRTQAALAGGLVGTIVPGLLLGASLALGPRIAADPELCRQLAAAMHEVRADSGAGWHGIHEYGGCR